MKSLLRSRILLVVVAVSSLLAPRATAQIIVGAPRVGDPVMVGRINFGPAFGIAEFQMGQIFRTPDILSTSLTSWSLWTTSVRTADDPEFNSTAPLQLSILKWDGSLPVGPALFTSAPITPTSSSNLGDQITLAIGLELDPTQLYIALVSAAGPPPTTLNQYAQSSINVTCNGPCSNTDLYVDGGLVAFQTSFNPATQMYRDITDHPLVFNYGADEDMSFQATFNAPVTATPEPASMVLMATGLLGLGGFARRRRTSAGVA